MVPIRYFVVKHDSQWRIEFDDTYQNGFTAQQTALIAAQEMARKKVQEGKKAEVLVQSENGIWYTEWTEKDV